LRLLDTFVERASWARLLVFFVGRPSNQNWKRGRMAVRNTGLTRSVANAFISGGQAKSRPTSPVKRQERAQGREAIAGDTRPSLCPWSGSRHRHRSRTKIINIRPAIPFCSPTSACPCSPGLSFGREPFAVSLEWVFQRRRVSRIDPIPKQYSAYCRCGRFACRTLEIVNHRGSCLCG
jgi:hypothetical protein